MTFVDCGLCVLRDWRRTDREALLRFANNRNVWRNLTHAFPHPYTDADAEWWFSHLENMIRPTAWAIDVEGLAVGAVGIIPGEGIFEKSAQFGYWLAEPYWGRGIATAAARGAAEYAFSQFELVRLEASVFEWNPASMRVLEKCGFMREGVLRRAVFKDGQVVDAVLYSRVL